MVKISNILQTQPPSGKCGYPASDAGPAGPCNCILEGTTRNGVKGTCTSFSDSAYCSASKANCTANCKGIWCPTSPAPQPAPHKCGYGCGTGATNCKYCHDFSINNYCNENKTNCVGSCGGMWCPTSPGPQPAPPGPQPAPHSKGMPEPAPSPGPKKGLSSGELAGIIVGVCALLLIIILIVLYNKPTIKREKNINISHSIHKN